MMTADSSFLKLVLQQCSRQMQSFSSADVMYLFLTLQHLEQGCGDDAAAGFAIRVVPPDLVHRLQTRAAAILHEFTPVEFAKCFEAMHAVHGVSKQFRSKVMLEIAYRIRIFDPKPCLDFLAVIRKYQGTLTDEPHHHQFESALYYRLAAPDSLKQLTQEEAAHLSKLVLHSKHAVTWEAKEALLCLLPNLRREKHLESTAYTLNVYAKLGIRDTPFANALMRVLRIFLQNY